MSKILDVKNLKISFRTNNGTVKAVRDISFSLNKGETLAIVGESGSGKSVTSKAILGISAGNAIVESGEIIYDGKDLLKIGEEDFHQIRGDKIAMIFQDPLSSLNPIMKIGKQLTEAMILKGKAKQKTSRDAFNGKLELLKNTMIKAVHEGGYTNLTGKRIQKLSVEEIEKLCKDFDTFEFKHIELEQAFNEAREAAEDAIPLIEDELFHIEKHAFKGYAAKIKQMCAFASRTVHEYVVKEDAAKVQALVKEIPRCYKLEERGGKFAVTQKKLEELLAIMKNAVAKDIPDFFRMGYYLTFANKPLPEMPVNELNEYLLKYLDDNFMLRFLGFIEASLKYSAIVYDKEKREALECAQRALKILGKQGYYNKNAVYACVNELIKEVEESIDPLEIHKDSIAYTFKGSLLHTINNYFAATGKNRAATRVYERQKAQYDRLIKQGKKPSWKVIPAAIIDLEDVKRDAVSIVERFINHYQKRLADGVNRNFAKETVDLIDFFKSNASGAAYKVTNNMAKRKAIKIMEEVGIPEAHIRYNQYPFEFSGGMRQRIVIAIALAANPDILICDEPTTALDVTIQAQILELINKLKKERNLSVIFITHDLGVVANMADRVAVMYAGKIVEEGLADEVFYDPKHPYTWALLSSMPDLDTNERLESIPGTPPNMIYPPEGDAFAARNKYALKIDFEQQPPMFQVSSTHRAATWLLHPNAPKVEMPKIIKERIDRANKLNGGMKNG